MPTKAEALAELARRGVAMPTSINPTDQKTLRELTTSAANIRGAREQAEEFMKLNRQRTTGGLLAIPGVSEFVANTLDDRVGKMQGLSNSMVSGMHVTPGPMTDADAKMYKTAIPNPDRTRGANEAMTRNIASKEQQLAARSAFYQKYAQRTGSLNGADVAFNRFWTDYSAKQKAPAPAGRRPAVPQKNAPKYLGTEN